MVASVAVERTAGRAEVSFSRNGTVKKFLVVEDTPCDLDITEYNELNEAVKVFWHKVNEHVKDEVATLLCDERHTFEEIKQVLGGLIAPGSEDYVANLCHDNGYECVYVRMACQVSVNRGKDYVTIALAEAVE